MSGITVKNKSINALVTGNFVINPFTVSNPFEGRFKDFLPNSRFVIQIIVRDLAGGATGF